MAQESCAVVESDVFPWYPHMLNTPPRGIGRVSCLPSNTFASNPEKPCLVSSWSSTICPVWPDYSLDRWPEQPSAKYSKLQQKAALIPFQRLKSTRKSHLEPTKMTSLSLVDELSQIIWLESVWYWAALPRGGIMLLTLFLAFSRFSYWMEVFNLVCFAGGFVMK